MRMRASEVAVRGRNELASPAPCRTSKSEYESALVRLRQEQPDLLPGFTAELEGLEEEGRARRQAKHRAARAARAKGQPAREGAKGRKGRKVAGSRGGGASG